MLMKAVDYGVKAIGVRSLPMKSSRRTPTIPGCSSIEQIFMSSASRSGVSY